MNFPVPTPVDSLLPGETAGPVEPSMLDGLLGELTAPVLSDMVTWEVTTRPGYAVRYRTDLDDAVVQGFVKLAAVKGKKALDGTPLLDNVRLGCLILARYCLAILKDGVDVGLTFTSQDLLDAYKVTRAAEAVRAFYGTDGGVVLHSRALTNRSGLTETGDPLESDPTQG